MVDPTYAASPNRSLSGIIRTSEQGYDMALIHHNVAVTGPSRNFPYVEPRWVRRWAISTLFHLHPSGYVHTDLLQGLPLATLSDVFIFSTRLFEYSAELYVD
jgi:hypothetical protein